MAIKCNRWLFVFVLGVSQAFVFGSTQAAQGADTHAELVQLFEEFREFVKPSVTDGVPDYTQAAMNEHRASLSGFQDRLSEMDVSAWPVSEQVDYQVVRAEMNGLDFYHRVLQPWFHNPGFYGTQRIPGFPSRGDGINVFMIEFPLTDDEVADLAMQLKAVPKLFDQARQNLSAPARELAKIAIRTKEKKILMFENLTGRLKRHHQELVPDAELALAAVRAYRDWLIETQDEMTFPAGVGKENFNWWMKNVWLYPKTWEECMNTAQREYGRAVAYLKLEENRNRHIPELPYVATRDGHARLWNKAEDHATRFARTSELFTVPDYLTPSGPHRPWVAHSDRDGECAEFFEQAERHDPMAQVGHNHLGHHLDSLRRQRDDRPIRSARALYGGLRAEAVSTFMEESAMVSGLHEGWELSPRSREVIYISLAWRAIRAIAALKMQSNEFTMDQALAYCVKQCPRGWECKEDMDTWYDIEINMLLPGHATTYINGKNEIERLMADRAMQQGNAFNMKDFFDSFFASGMIPISLTRWELTGLDNDVRQFVDPPKGL